MEAIASGGVSRWANHSCGVATSLAVNSTETIVPVKSALNMNTSDVGTADVDTGPSVDEPNERTLVLHINEGLSFHLLWIAS